MEQLDVPLCPLDVRMLRHDFPSVPIRTERPSPASGTFAAREEVMIGGVAARERRGNPSFFGAGTRTHRATGGRRYAGTRECGLGLMHRGDPAAL